MVSQQTTPTTTVQALAREAVAAAITEAATQVLAGWDDDRLLGQTRARIIVQVTRAVRVRIGRDTPALAAQVTSWQLKKLLDERMLHAVGRAQVLALNRRYADEAPGDSGLVFEVGEPINGVTIIGITFPSDQDANQDNVCSPDA